MKQRQQSRFGPNALPAGLSLPLEVRVHGRGGQGGVTCAKLIAVLYTQMGLHVQTFGDYGSERSGAPVQAFTRVDRVAISNRNKIYQPDHLDRSGRGPDGKPGSVRCRAGRTPVAQHRWRSGELRRPVCDYRFGAVDATAIAREHGIGSASVVIVNTTMLGAYARLLGLPLTVLEKAYASLGLADDLAAAQRAYDTVSLRQPVPAGPSATAAARVAAPPPVGLR